MAKHKPHSDSETDFVPAPATEKATAFAVRNDLPTPPVRKRGGYRQEKFPFSTLEVDQGFVIPVTEAKPEPWKSYQSTVSGAQRRFANVDGEKTRKTKDGKEKTIPNLVPTRRFSLFEAEENGEKIAVVKRTA